MQKVLFLLVFMLMFACPLMNASEKQEINVAIYVSSIEQYTKEIEEILHYEWEYNGITYHIRSSIVNNIGVLQGELESFDILVIPGSGRPYFDALNPAWKKAIQIFVEHGGGYLGICGGANLASMGFNNSCSVNTFLDATTLGIANIYVNDEQSEEWQYLWRSNWSYGGLPLNLSIIENNVPIFSGFYGTQRSVRYWGGPGMYDAHAKDERFGSVVPLALYSEEPMEVAPLHYWTWHDGEAIPLKNITTDIKGIYAGVATTFGKGRIVLFGPHPERNTFFDGHVKEFPVRPRLSPFTWFIYDWVSENASTDSYNWWVIRRSVAWLAECPIPPANELAAKICEPEGGIYWNGRKIISCNTTIITGSFRFSGKIIDGDMYRLYVDGEVFEQGYGNVELMMNLPQGIHRLALSAEHSNERAFDEKVIFSLPYQKSKAIIL